MRYLEEELVAVYPLVGPLLQREQAFRVQVALVVRRRIALEDRLRVVFLLRLRSLVGGHARSILSAWETSSARPPRRARPRTRRSPRGSDRGRSTSSSGRSTCSARARRCDTRSSRTGRRR